MNSGPIEDQTMATIESLIVFSEAVRSSAAVSAGSSPCGESDGADEWRARVESRLDEWDKGAKTPDEDGLIPPTQQAVATARQVAVRLRDEVVPVPLRLVQDGAGGIVFEWKHGATTDKLRLDPSGSIEAMGFCDSKLIYRHSVSCN